MKYCAAQRDPQGSQRSAKVTPVSETWTKLILGNKVVVVIISVKRLGLRVI